MPEKNNLPLSSHVALCYCFSITIVNRWTTTTTKATDDMGPRRKKGTSPQRKKGPKSKFIVRTFTKRKRNTPLKNYKQSTIVPLTKKDIDDYALRARQWANMRGKETKQVEWVGERNVPGQVAWKLPWTDAGTNTAVNSPKPEDQQARADHPKKQKKQQVPVKKTKQKKQQVPVKKTKQVASPTKKNRRQTLLLPLSSKKPQVPKYVTPKSPGKKIKTKQSLLRPVTDEEAARYKRRRLEMIELEKLQAKYGLLGGPTKKTTQQELSFGKVQPKKQKKEQGGFGGSVIIPLHPRKGCLQERSQGRPFLEFIHQQPLWIQNFQVNRSQGRKTAKKKIHLMAVCMKLLEQFFGASNCTSVSLVGRGQDQACFFKTSQVSFSDQVSRCKETFPDFQEELYERIRLHSRCYNKTAQSAPSFFMLGKGRWHSGHTFIRGVSASLTATEEASFRNFTSEGGQLSLGRLKADKLAFGSMSLKMMYKPPQITDKNTVPKRRSPKKLKQYRLLVEVVAECEVEGLSPLRSSWEQVFPASCSCPVNKTPCAACRGCRQRFAQVVFVVLAAAGVSDENILARLGAVFRSQYYRHFSIEEWAETPLEEIVQIYRVCSKQVQNALYTRLIFQYLAQTSLPRTLEELTCLKGIGKKSACLLLQAALGIQAGIAVDRHLMRAGKALGWIPDSCSDSDTSLASSYLERFIPECDYAAVNNVVSGLCQTAAKSAAYKQRVLDIAASKGKQHFEVTKKVVESVT